MRPRPSLGVEFAVVFVQVTPAFVEIIWKE
jgi:hypothetical protein